MALKNLFDMVKADRYTADGREALIKAQEEETEDKVYQIGEISQKTGLQKTANGWVKPKNGKQPGAKKEAEAALKKQNAAPANKTTIRQGPNTKTLNETPAEHVQKNLDAYKGYQPYDMEELVLKPSGYEKQTSARVPGGGQSITYTKNGAEDITLFFDKHGELENADVAAGSKPAAPRREAVSAGRMMKDLDGNFWSRPEDFKEDITSRGWDVDEMTNEYAVISNEAGSQYEVRFDDHSDDGDLTVRNFKALQIDEDDDDDSLEDSAPSLSEIVDRVYNIGEISEKTGLQKTAQGWKPPKETKFGKVKQNKEGQWGVQTKQGKGSDFLKHKSEKEASRALANYTAGYNTTERSKQDPHSDQARQVKHWDKETEKIRKQNRAEGRAAHAAQFQNPAGKTSRASKEEAIRKDLGLTEGEDMSRFSDEQIEKMYAKTQQTPEQQKADFDKSKIGQAVNKGRQEFAAEKTRQKELASKTNAIGLPKESKPEGRNFRSELEANPKGAYDFEKTVEKSIPLSAGDKEILGRVKSFMQEESTDYKNALKSVATGLVNGNKLRGDWYPEKEKSLLKIAKAVGMDEEVKSYVKNLAKGYDFGYSEDAAPRVLTGDTRIRVRKA